MTSKAVDDNSQCKLIPYNENEKFNVQTTPFKGVKINPYNVTKFNVKQHKVMHRLGLLSVIHTL